MSAFPDPATPFGARVRQRLRDDVVIWMTSVDASGTPQPNPVWFVVDGDTLIVYNRPDALRLKHIARNPRVSFNLDGDRVGDDIIVLTGTAHIADEIPPAHELPSYLAKYADRATAVSSSPEAFAAEYAIPVRATIDRVRGF